MDILVRGAAIVETLSTWPIRLRVCKGDWFRLCMGPQRAVCGRRLEASVVIHVRGLRRFAMNSVGPDSGEEPDEEESDESTAEEEPASGQ